MRCYIRKPLSCAAGVILGASTIDLLSTLAVLRAGIGIEANPILAACLELGMPIFVAAKVLLTACPVLALELLRARSALAGWGLRFVAVAYPVIYLFGVLHVNS